MLHLFLYCIYLLHIYILSSYIRMYLFIIYRVIYILIYLYIYTFIYVLIHMYFQRVFGRLEANTLEQRPKFWKPPSSRLKKATVPMTVLEQLVGDCACSQKAPSIQPRCDKCCRGVAESRTVIPQNCAKRTPDSENLENG